MRGIIPILLMAASLPLGAWELPSQNELAAVQGDALQSVLCEAGLPVLPTRQEALQKAGFRLGLERLAIKQTLVYRISRAKAEYNRITPENNAATASLGRQTGAPAVFCEYLEALAGQRLSRRQEYAVNQALQLLLLDTYGIDALQIRLLSEALELPAAEHMDYMLNMPIYGMFNASPTALPPRWQVMSDMQLMTTLMREVSLLLRQATDKPTADSAASELLLLMPLWNTTQRTRMAMSQHEINLSPLEKVLMEFLDSAVAQVVQERRRLTGCDWFGSTRLQSIDELFR